MHRRLALGFALAGVVLAAIYVARYWSVYTAQSLVYIQPTPSAVLEQAPMHWPYNYDPATYDSYIQQQMLSMTRPDVLAGAVNKLDPGVWQQSGESDRERGRPIEGRGGSGARGDQLPGRHHGPCAECGHGCGPGQRCGGKLYREHLARAKGQRCRRLTMLKEERERIKKELDDDRTEQAALNAQLGVAAIGPEAPEHYDTDIGQIHEELVKARTDHDEAAARLTSISSGNGHSSAALDAEADQSIATDPGLSSLKTVAAGAARGAGFADGESDAEPSAVQAGSGGARKDRRLARIRRRRNCAPRRRRASRNSCARIWTAPRAWRRA